MPLELLRISVELATGFIVALGTARNSAVAKQMETTAPHIRTACLVESHGRPARWVH